MGLGCLSVPKTGRGALKVSVVGSTEDWTVSPNHQAWWCPVPDLGWQGWGEGVREQSIRGAQPWLH